jgi:hypothetical protein
VQNKTMPRQTQCWGNKLTPLPHKKQKCRAIGEHEVMSTAKISRFFFLEGE